MEKSQRYFEGWIEKLTSKPCLYILKQKELFRRWPSSIFSKEKLAASCLKSEQLGCYLQVSIIWFWKTVLTKLGWSHNPAKYLTSILRSGIASSLKISLKICVSFLNMSAIIQITVAAYLPFFGLFPVKVFSCSIYWWTNFWPAVCGQGAGWFRWGSRFQRTWTWICELEISFSFS